MRIHPFRTTSLALAVAFALVSAATLRAETGTDSPFSEANSAYERGDFTAAADHYRALVDSGLRAPDAYFNLGNAEYRLNRSGEAALAYERALALAPSHAESRQNLRFLQRKTGLLEFERSNFARFAQRFEENHLVLGLAVAGWTFVLAFAALVFLRPRRALFGFALTFALAGFLATAFGATLLATQRLNLPPDALAIVTADDAKAFTAPAKSADDVIALPPGSEVRVLERRESWAYVAIPGNLRGWVESAAIKSLDV